MGKMRIALALVPGLLAAHEPITTKLTWTQEISRIVYKRCLACHYTGSQIPLVTYDEARPWAKAIRDEVLERRMPPWGAVKGFGEFRDDHSLTQPEIDMIVNWVEGGAPKGDDIYLPAVPPAPPKTAPVRPARGLTVRTELKLKADLTVAAIRPLGLDAGGWMQVLATLPDGSVRSLLWLRDYRKDWTRAYQLREPLRLPAGARITVHSAPPAAAVISSVTPAR